MEILFWILVASPLVLPFLFIWWTEHTLKVTDDTGRVGVGDLSTIQRQPIDNELFSDLRFCAQQLEDLRPNVAFSRIQKWGDRDRLRKLSRDLVFLVLYLMNRITEWLSKRVYSADPHYVKEGNERLAGFLLQCASAAERSDYEQLLKLIAEDDQYCANRRMSIHDAESVALPAVS